MTETDRDKAMGIWHSKGLFEKYQSYGSEVTRACSQLLTAAGLQGKDRIIILIEAIQELEEES